MFLDGASRRTLFAIAMFAYSYIWLSIYSVQDIWFICFAKEKGEKIDRDSFVDQTKI